MRAFALVLAVALVAGPVGVAQSPPPKVVTLADVLKQVKAGASPADILSHCDTVFTLTDDERDALVKAKAPPALVDALQTKRIRIGDVTDFVVILDCSGSMKDEIAKGQTKMDTAKKVVGDLFKAIPNGRNLAFIVYGHDAKLECQAVKVVRKLGPVDDDARKELADALAGFEPAGHTPIANSLKEAGEVLKKSKGMSQVVLITDGVETCKGDPAAEAEALTQAVNNLRAVEVIGVGLKDDEKAAVAVIATRGRGKFYDADSAAKLKASLDEVVPVKPVPVKPELKAKVDGSQVKGLGKMTVDEPAPLELGTTAKAALEKNASIYAAAKLAADTEYLLVVDVRQKSSTNISANVSLLDEDGIQVGKELISFIDIDSQFRKVAKVSVKKGGKYIVRVQNTHEKADFFVTLTPVPVEGDPTPKAADWAKYDPKSQGLTVPFGGDTLPEVIKAGVEAKGKLDAGGTKYFVLDLPKGDHKVVVGLTNANDVRTNLSGYLALLEGDGGGQRELISFIEIDTTSRKNGEFTLKEAGTVILRLKVGGEPMKYTVKVRPASE